MKKELHCAVIDEFILNQNEACEFTFKLEV